MADLVTAALDGSRELRRLGLRWNVCGFSSLRTSRSRGAASWRWCANMQFEASLAESGAQALELLAADAEKAAPASRFNLVLSDVMMEGLSGPELLVEIRSRYGPELCVIMLSASSHALMVEQCIRRGASSYLRKPVRLNDFANIWQFVMQHRLSQLRQKQSILEAEAVRQRARERTRRHQDAMMQRMHNVLQRQLRWCWRISKLSTDLIISASTSGLFLFMSPKCRRLLGLQLEEEHADDNETTLAGAELLQYVHDEDIAALRKMVFSKPSFDHREAGCGGDAQKCGTFENLGTCMASLEFELRMATVDGEWVAFRLPMHVISMEDGQRALIGLLPRSMLKNWLEGMIKQRVGMGGGRALEDGKAAGGGSDGAHTENGAVAALPKGLPLGSPLGSITKQAMETTLQPPPQTDKLGEKLDKKLGNTSAETSPDDSSSSDSLSYLLPAAFASISAGPEWSNSARAGASSLSSGSSPICTEQSLRGKERPCGSPVCTEHLLRGKGRLADARRLADERNQLTNERKSCLGMFRHERSELAALKSAMKYSSTTSSSRGAPSGEPWKSFRRRRCDTSTRSMSGGGPEVAAVAAMMAVVAVVVMVVASTAAAAAAAAAARSLQPRQRWPRAR